MLTDKQREREWHKGFHTNAEDKRLQLREMPLQHLRNTIRLFSYLDVSPLRKELRRRERRRMINSFKRVLNLLGAESKVNAKTRRQRRRKRRAEGAHTALSKYIESI